MTTLLTPQAILASEPERKQGLKTPWNKDGDRKITFRWAIGTGTEFGEPANLTALLSIHHYKASETRRGVPHYAASLWRETDKGDGIVGITMDGRNGTQVCVQTAGAHRFKADTLDAFADYAKRELQATTDPVLLGYFDITVAKPGR